MLVALGCALFVLFQAEAGMAQADLSRVIQGVATGIGFIGAGTILKRTDSGEVEGLTTAAGIWLTGAVGLAVGGGRVQQVVSDEDAFVPSGILRTMIGATTLGTGQGVGVAIIDSGILNRPDLHDQI
jgi:hypothetical protein